MKFVLEPNQLTITLQGFEQLWALKRRLQIPHYAVENVDYATQVPSMQDYQGYLRVPGTSIPWNFYAGMYQRQGKREFRYVKMRQPGVLVISCKSGTLNYDQVRLTCEPTVAQAIADWWHDNK